MQLVDAQVHSDQRVNIMPVKDNAQQTNTCDRYDCTTLYN